MEYEETEIENKIPVREIAEITKELETPQVDEEENTSTIYKKEDNTNNIKQIEEKVADISKEAIEKIKADEVSKGIDESKLAEDENKIDKLKETPQLDEIKTTDAKDATPQVEITETKESSETPPVMGAKEIERADIKETAPIVDFKEVKEIVPQTVELTEKLTEKFEPSKLPVTIEKSLIIDVAEKKIEVEEPSQITYETEEKIEIEQPSILNSITEKNEIEEPVLLSNIIQDKIEVAEPSPKEEIKVIELLPTADKVTEKTERIQPVTEPPPIIKSKEQQEIEAMEQLVLEVKPKREEDEKLEEVPKELTLLAEDEKATEKIEIIQPVTESPTMIKEEREIGVIEKSVLQANSEREDEQIAEISQELIPLTELSEKEKEEERAVEEEKIRKELIPPTKSPVEVKNEEIPRIQEKPEIVEAEKIIPTTEAKPIEERAPTLQIDLRVAPQQYFIIAKIQEKEIAQILPMMTPQCMACCLVSNNIFYIFK